MKYYTTRMKTSREDYIHGLTPTNKLKGAIKKTVAEPQCCTGQSVCICDCDFWYGKRF